MVLILVRHTTPQVAPGICYGRTDLDVSDTFENEAGKVACALPSFIRIVTSPLRRCVKLADHLSQQTGVPIRHDPRLAEMDFGTWEGCLWSKIPRHELDHWAQDFLHARPHGGESVAMLRARIQQAFGEIETSQGPTLVVTHAGVIRAALSTGDTAGDFEASIPFGGCVQIEANKEDIHA